METPICDLESALNWDIAEDVPKDAPKRLGNPVMVLVPSMPNTIVTK